MPGIRENRVGLSSSDYLLQQNMKSRSERAAFENRNQSGGLSDLIHENTPDVDGMLSSNREISANKAHKGNVTYANLRSAEQISKINIFHKIATEFSKRLLGVRLSNGIPDLEFNNWCKTQLSNIGNQLNKQMGGGSYIFAENSISTPPINTAILVTPLPPGPPSEPDYLQGQFTGNTAIRQSADVVSPDSATAAHPGIEALVRALRMGMIVDVNQGVKDETSGAAIDLLTNTAIPKLGSLLTAAGELGKQADDLDTQLTFDELASRTAFAKTAYEPQAKTIQDMLEAKTLVKLQTNLIASTSADSQNFSETVLAR